MSDHASLPPQSVIAGAPPPKGGAFAAKFVITFILILIIVGAVAYVRIYAVPPSAGTTVGVRGGDMALKSQLDAVAARLQALETRVEKLEAAPASAVVPAAASPADLAHMQSDMVALSSAMAALQAEVKTTGATAAEAREVSASRVAAVVAFIQLRDAAASGRGFVNELAVLRDAAKSDAALQTAVSRLEPYAAKGAPTGDALRDDLLEREPGIRVAMAKDAAEHWWQRVFAELQGVITVRRMNGGAGGVLAQLETALATGGDAVPEVFGRLPPDAQSQLAGWREKFDARRRIDDALRDIAARFTTLPAATTP
jgi:hypothetical protein